MRPREQLLQPHLHTLNVRVNTNMYVRVDTNMYVSVDTDNAAMRGMHMQRRASRHARTVVSSDTASSKAAARTQQQQQQQQQHLALV